MIISKKIKLEISPKDAATLEFMQSKCRALYNWWVMKLRDGEPWPGIYAAKKTLKESRKVDPDRRTRLAIGQCITIGVSTPSS